MFGSEAVFDRDGDGVGLRRQGGDETVGVGGEGGAGAEAAPVEI